MKDLRLSQKDDEMYKNYTELPTILWIFGMLGLALSGLLIALITTGQVKLFFLSTGIVAGSIGLSVFIVSILFPLARDVLVPKKKQDKDETDEELF